MTAAVVGHAGEVLAKVARVFKWLDSNEDGALSPEELKPAGEAKPVNPTSNDCVTSHHYLPPATAVQRLDGKLTLASLDPGTGSILSFENLWNASLAGLIIFFLVSIIDQMAKSKQVGAMRAFECCICLRKEWI